MAIWRGTGGPGDATTDAANEASVASTKAAEAEASASAAASSAASAATSATSASNDATSTAADVLSAAASALAASNSATAAATSETNAGTSATNAATSETNAANSATSASTAQTAAETAQTAAEAAQRELFEEVGIRGEITRLLGVFDSRIWKSNTSMHLFHFVFLAEAKDPTPCISTEALDVGYFSEDKLPPLSSGHHLRVPVFFKQLRSEAPIPYLVNVTSSQRISC